MISLVITLTGKGRRTFPSGIVAAEVAGSFGIERGADLVGLRVGHGLFDLQSPVWNGGSAVPVYLSDDSPDSRRFYRQSFSHIMAQALKRLYPAVKLATGQASESGFYYEFESREPFTQDALSAVEDEMRRVIAAGYSFERMELAYDEARALLISRKEALKLELLDDLFARGRPVSFYKTGEFLDLSTAPHVFSTNIKGYFKLLDITDTYWRGDRRRQALYRIHATAFLTREDLSACLRSIEDAKKQDHRKLGRELDLFSIHDDVGKGLLLWHPRGAVIRQVIEEYYRKQHQKAGYDFVYTPHLAKCDVWQTSGHLDFCRDAMLPAMEVDGDLCYLKPVNCPLHVQIYKGRLRSYRELPVRLTEWGTVYRFEGSADLHGANRLRGFTQDDAHIFCSREQIAEEIDSILEMCVEMLNDFGLANYQFFLGSRPESTAGTDEDWRLAERLLVEALQRSGELFVESEGDGAFYGPKIDLCVKDALGRQWQLSTIQLDFNLPQVFELAYIGEDGREHRPVMIHRALFGSIERFFAILVEHYAGHFPLWLAPVQVVVMPVAQAHNEYSQGVVRQLKKAGIRSELDASNNTLNYRIRAAQLMKAPCMVIIGDKEVGAGSLSVRAGTGETEEFSSQNEFLKYLAEVIESKR